MGETEITIFIFLATVILLIFIAGIIVFVLQYRNRKILYQKEKTAIEEQHKIDMLNMKLQSQNETMHFIGNEIHDSVAQKLTLASIYSQRIEFENEGSELSRRLADVSKIINESLVELKQLSRNLTDQQLQTASLDELILLECDKVNSTGLCTAKYSLGILPDMSIAVKSALLRIIQEFIQNSIKHARCREIIIYLSLADGDIRMSLNDDGIGFDADQHMHRGMGLGSIQRRIQKLGGTYLWENRNGTGAHLKLSIPADRMND